MNWRQGMWRAWALMAALWLVLVFSEEEFLGPVEDYWNYYSAERSSDILPPDDLYLPDSYGLDEVIQALRLADEAGNTEDAQRLAHMARDMQDAQNEMEAFEAAKRQLIDFLQAAFLPPLAVLALGLAVAWVLRGFRKIGPGS
jgi:hypothetical protein